MSTNANNTTLTSVNALKITADTVDSTNVNATNLIVDKLTVDNLVLTELDNNVINITKAVTINGGVIGKANGLALLDQYGNIPIDELPVTNAYNTSSALSIPTSRALYLGLVNEETSRNTSYNALNQSIQVIQTNLNSEINERSNADTNLDIEIQTYLNGLSEEISNRINADNDLNTRIDDETDKYIGIISTVDDSALQTQLNAMVLKNVNREPLYGDIVYVEDKKALYHYIDADGLIISDLHDIDSEPVIFVGDGTTFTNTIDYVPVNGVGLVTDIDGATLTYTNSNTIVTLTYTTAPTTAPTSIKIKYTYATVKEEYSTQYIYLKNVNSEDMVLTGSGNVYKGTIYHSSVVNVELVTANKNINISYTHNKTSVTLTYSKQQNFTTKSTNIFYSYVTANILSGDQWVLYAYSTNPKLLNDATEISKGVTRIATQEEVDAGKNDFKYITPLKLEKDKVNGVAALDNDLRLKTTYIIYNADSNVNDNGLSGVSDKNSVAYWVHIANGQNATIHFVKGTYVFATSLVIPSSICLDFDEGAVLKLNDGVDITLNCSIKAGAYKIFDLGTGSDVLGKCITDFIYPEWFGATGVLETDIKYSTVSVSNESVTLKLSQNGLSYIGGTAHYPSTAVSLVTAISGATLTNDKSTITLTYTTTQTATTKIVSVKYSYLDPIANNDYVDTKSIQLALDLAKQTGNSIKLLNKLYYIDKTLYAGCNGDMSDGTIIGNSTAFYPFIFVGGNNTSILGDIKNISLKLPKIKNITKPTKCGWANCNTGIEFGNCYYCDFLVPYITGFGNGILIDKNYINNHVKFEYIYANKINLHIIANSLSDTYSNEAKCINNIFYGGRIGSDIDDAIIHYNNDVVGDGINTSLTYNKYDNTCWYDTRNIKMESLTKDDNGLYGNIFIGQDLSSSSVEYNIDLSYAKYNDFYNCNYSGSRAKQLIFDHNTSNSFYGGYESESIVKKDATGSENINTNMFYNSNLNIARSIATESAAGISRLATEDEILDGTSNDTVITPFHLLQRTATTTRLGLVRFSTEAEISGNSSNTVISPSNFATALYSVGSVFTAIRNGLVPKTNGVSNKFLKSDGTWDTYVGGTGITVDNLYINHKNYIAAGSTGIGTVENPNERDSTNVPVITYNAQGHLTEIYTLPLKTPYQFKVSLDGGTEINKDYYPFDGNAERALNIKHGTNVTFDIVNNALTINSHYIDTTYTAGTGLVLNGTTFNHKNNVTGKTVGSSNQVPIITFDDTGHISKAEVAVTNKILDYPFTVKFNSGTVEGTDLYTYNDSIAKTIDIKAGSNVIFTPDNGALTISVPTASLQNIDSEIAVSSWDTSKQETSGYNSCTIENENITATSSVELKPNLEIMTNEQLSAYQVSNMYISSINNGSVSIRSYGILPTINIPIILTVNTSVNTVATEGTFKIRINSGSLENTSLYSFNGTLDKSLNIVAGNNVTFTNTEHTLTINASGGGNTPNSTQKAYITGSVKSENNTDGLVFDTGVYLGNTAGSLYATTFYGSLQGTASNATTADSSLTATTADKVKSSFAIKINNGTTENTNSYIFNGEYSKTLNIKAGNNINLTASANELVISSSSSSYPTAFAWANGTTAGPTGSLTGTNLTPIDFGAIPSASGTTSGIVTTGNQTFSGVKTINVPTQTNGNTSTLAASTEFVMNAIGRISNAMIYKGTIGTNGTITALPSTHDTGDTYKVITAGTYAGQVCEVGDMIICVNTGTVANNADWTVVQTNEDGSVIGPVNSVSNNIAVFNGTSGKLIKDSGFTIATSVPSAAKFTDTTYTANDGLTLTGTVFSHTVPTGVASSVNNSGRTYIQDISLDKFGHIIGLTSATETVTDTTYTAGTGLSLSSTEFKLANTSVTAGSYGTASNTSLNMGGTFDIPHYTVDEQGRLTNSTNVTITIPSYIITTTEPSTITLPEGSVAFVIEE